MGAKQAKPEAHTNVNNESKANRTVSFKIDQQEGTNSVVAAAAAETETEQNFIFSKFAENNFGRDHNHEFTKETIQKPLLKLDAYGDQIASLAVWITIQRFMGDLNDIQTTDVIARVCDVFFF